MKLYALLFVVLSICANAQTKNYSLTLNVGSANQFKYVYLIDNIFDDKFEKHSLNNGLFSVNGTYKTENKFDAVPSLSLLLSNIDLSLDQIRNERLLSDRRHFHCTVIYGDKINVNYINDKKLFEISGDENNQLQNKFERLEADFRNKRDSVLNVDTIKLQNDNNKQKIIENTLNEIFINNIKDKIKLCKANLNSKVALENFFNIVISPYISGHETKEIFERFSVQLKNSKYGQRISQDIEDKINKEELLNSPTYNVGMNFPNVTALNERTKEVKLNTAYGTYTLIDFWATWCAPCRKEIPNLLSAYQKYQKLGFKIISISIDEEKNIKNWQSTIMAEKMGNFVNLINPNDKLGILSRLKIVGIPANFLIDKTGKIVATNLRGAQLEDELKRIFKL